MDIVTLAAAKEYTNKSVEKIIESGTIVDPTLSLSGAAADAKITGNRLALLENYVTPQMFGAKADGVTDDTTAIQTMFDNVAGVGKVYFPHGNYLTTTPIVVEKVPDIEMDGVIMSNHAGVAFILGKSGASAFTDKTIKLKIKKQGTKLEEGSVGLVIYSSARNTFYLDTVTNFETNVKLLSEADKGIWFNTFHLNNLNHARYGLYLDGVDGWINDNLFIGGSISVNSDSTAIVINHGGSNVFLKQGLEGAGTCVHIISGSVNTFLQARCERATYGLVIDEGKDNVMYSNYAKPEFINNSRYTTNGVIQTGIRGVCKCPSVVVDRLDENKFLKCGSKIIPVYCKTINASTGVIGEAINAESFRFENNAWFPVNYRPVFTFDTTKNKKFDFAGEQPCLRLILYNSEGRISLTDETISQYLSTDQITAPWILTSAFGDTNPIVLNKPFDFEVSNEVTKIDLIFVNNYYSADTITGFNIHTEYPCYPIRDEILTVPSIPTNGYLGAKVIYNGNLYIYNGTEWKREDYVLTEEDKTEIAEQAASLIDVALLSALGSGVIE